MSSLKNIRTDYTKGELSPDDLGACPAAQLKAWISEAEQEGVKDPNALVFRLLIVQVILLVG